MLRPREPRRRRRKRPPNADAQMCGTVSEGSWILSARSSLILPTQQIRAILFCSPDRLFFPPFGDLCVISGEQNLRNLPAAELGGPGVLRRFQGIIAEAVVVGRLFMAKRSWR